MDRQKVIFRTSIVGILGNVALVIVKMIIGLAANSIAIVLDAINNLTDALSSIVTIVMTKLSGKPADKKHPFGYGRMEYFGTAIISFMILYAGIKALTSSIDRIMHPVATDYTTVTIIIVVVGIVAKFIIGAYFKKQGKKADSDSLIASGTDATMDAVVSCGTLVSIFVTMFSGVVIDGWVGAIIALFIIKAGFELLGETVSTILGEKVDGDLAAEIKKAVRAHEGVMGAYDLVLHNYGPMQHVGTVNIEIDEAMTAKEIFHLTKEINRDIMDKFGIYMTVSIYAVNTGRSEYTELERDVRNFMKKQEYVLGVHAFYVDKERAIIQFDTVVDFDAKDAAAEKAKYVAALEKEFPEWKFEMRIDRAFHD